MTSPGMGDCRICRGIPDATDERPLPKEVDQLQSFGRLRRCPLCATYYSYFYDHDSGGGTSPGGTDESISRLTVDETIQWVLRAVNEMPFEPKPTLEADLERLLRAHVPDEPKDVLIARVEKAVAAREMLGNEAAQMAAHLLGERRAVEAMPTLARALGLYELRGYAARALAAMGEVAMPTLLAQLVVAEPIARLAAACGLGHLARVEGNLAPAIQRALIERLLAVREPREQAAIAWAIGMTGSSEAAFASVTALFGADYTWPRDAAVRAVARMGPVTVPSLIRLLAHERTSVVEDTVKALGALGPAARDALPVLEGHRLATRLSFYIDRARAAIMAR